MVIPRWFPANWTHNDIEKAFSNIFRLEKSFYAELSDKEKNHDIKKLPNNFYQRLTKLLQFRHIFVHNILDIRSISYRKTQNFSNLVTHFMAALYSYCYHKAKSEKPDKSSRFQILAGD